MIHSDADQFFEEIKQKIKQGIAKKDIDLEKLVKEIVSYNVNFLTEFQRLTKKIEAANDYDLLELYGDIFKVILRYLNHYREDNKVKEIAITDIFIEKFIDDIVDVLVIEKLCFNCKSPNIYKTNSPFDETRTVYFCRHCQRSVKVFQNIKYLPIFLIYLNKWMLDFNIRDLNKEKPKNNRDKDFIFYLFSDCLDFFKDKGSLDTLVMLYEILMKNDIDHAITNDPRNFQTALLENLQESLNRQDFYDFFIGKKYYNLKYGEIPKDIDLMIVESIVKSLKSGEISKIKYAIDNLIDDEFFEITNLSSNNKFKKKIEKNFYTGLGHNLRAQKFENFRLMLDSSIDFDIFIDVKKIPNRFEIISTLILDCIREVSEGYQTSSLGKQIEILRFCNDYNLFERNLKEDDIKLIENLKKDTLLMSNFHDLFGEVVSDSFILFIRKIIPQQIYQFFIGAQSSYIQDWDQLAFYIKNIFFNQYSIYGLSVRYLSSVKSFINEFRKQYLKNKDKLMDDFMEFPISYNYQAYFYIEYERDPYTIVKKHLVAPDVIFKNIEKFLSKNNYKFYSLSMVLLGGLGPQGHGFTYSTPKGEVIEICSDAKENEAIIVKYKQFLKQQFLVRLEKELKEFKVHIDVIHKITKYLLEILDQNELINYYKKNRILRKIKEFLSKDTQRDEILKINIEFETLIDDITNAMNNILREIKMEDQFKTRMDLISKNEMKSEDIAKMTSLRQKSHYDVLRERFFFQYIVDWFYDVYLAEKSR